MPAAGLTRRLVACDPEQPGLCRLRPGTEARGGDIGRGKNLREQIGGELWTTTATHQPARDKTLMPTVEDSERLLLRVASGEQLRVGGVLPDSRHRKLSSASVAVCDRDRGRQGYPPRHGSRVGPYRGTRSERQQASLPLSARPRFWLRPASSRVAVFRTRWSVPRAIRYLCRLRPTRRIRRAGSTRQWER